MNRPKTIDEALDIWDGKRPRMLPGIVSYYDNECSIIPDSLRASFEDGRTAVYELKTTQPSPVIMENIRIIRKWKQGYVNKPARRRARK